MMPTVMPEPAALAQKRADASAPAVFLMNDSFQTGGSERQFAALARGLDRDAFHVSIGCIQNRGTFLEGMGEVATFPLNGSLYKPASWKTRARLARHLRDTNIEIAHAFDFYTNLTLLPAAWWARTRVIIGSARQLGDLLTPAQFKAQLWAYRMADAIVCNSQAAADRLSAAGIPTRKLSVIRNGMPASVFAPATPALPRVPGTPRVGMIARMNARSKNHSGLLRVLALVREQIPNIEALLAGDGPLRAELEQQSRDLGLSQNVRFLGDRRDIPAICASLDLSVLPSLSESLSNAVIESMAQGVPVIAARVGGNEELLGDERGVLVPANDDQALAKAILDLLQNESRRNTMGARAQGFALENFTLEIMCKQHEHLYRQLLQAKTKR